MIMRVATVLIRAHSTCKNLVELQCVTKRKRCTIDYVFESTVLSGLDLAIASWSTSGLA